MLNSLVEDRLEIPNLLMMMNGKDERNRIHLTMVRWQRKKERR